MLLLLWAVALPAFVLGQRQFTTLDAQSCASPSCTVTPTVLSAVTVRPSPATIHPPGASFPVVLSFTPITLRNFKPAPTVLANNGRGTLTLKRTTISNIKVTATTHYPVSPTQELSVAVEVDVHAEAQLFFSFDSNPVGVCQIHGLQNKAKKRWETPLRKRDFTLANMGTDFAEWDGFIKEARQILTRVVQRFEVETGGSESAIKAIKDDGLSRYFKSAGYPRLLSMAKAQLRALDEKDTGIRVILTTLNDGANDAQKASRCPNGVLGKTLPSLDYGTTIANPDPDCAGIVGLTIICPTAVARSTALPTDRDEFCKSTLFDSFAESGEVSMRNALKSGRCYDFSSSPGSGAALIMHELTHWPSVAHAGGFDEGDWTNKGEANQEVYSEPGSDTVCASTSKLRNLRNDRIKPNGYLRNADSYAIAYLNWYLMDWCKDSWPT